MRTDYPLFRVLLLNVVQLLNGILWVTCFTPNTMLSKAAACAFLAHTNGLSQVKSRTGRRLCYRCIYLPIVSIPLTPPTAGCV